MADRFSSDILSVGAGEGVWLGVAVWVEVARGAAVGEEVELGVAVLEGIALAPEEYLAVFLISLTLVSGDGWLPRANPIPAAAALIPKIKE